MWNDNESSVDLLGFEYLADCLEVLLTDPNLLPLTIGVTGDWGSGKSSLMRLAAQRLEATPEDEPNYIVVEFNPWRYEDFAAVKVALMTAVLDAVQAYATDCIDDPQTKQTVLARVRKLRPAVAKLAALMKFGSTVGGPLVGLDPGTASALGDVADVALTAAAAGGTGVGEDDADEDGPTDDDRPAADSSAPSALHRIADFHTEFEGLIGDLGDEIAAVVVFIDDMDRCDVSTIIATFETIRLFLNAPKTAYVIGAHTKIIEAALEAKYPARQAGDKDLAKHYLEKMLQTDIAVPPLSEPETLTFISLLYAQRNLGPDSDEFAKVLQFARAQRTKNELDVAMNVGFAVSALGQISPELRTLLERSERIGPPIAQGLRGNPRQIKRFLNAIELRLRVADKRDLHLDPEVLAKMMVLEQRNHDAFESIFHWQIEQAGKPAQLADAERLVRDGDASGISSETKNWAVRPDVASWLKMDPPLADQVLGPYFTFSRSGMKNVARASRLSPAQQVVIDAVMTDKPNFVNKALALDDIERAAAMEVLLEAMVADPKSKAMPGLLQIAAQDEPTRLAFVAQLKKLPGGQIPRAFPPALASALGRDGDIDEILTIWDQDPKAPKSAIKAAMRKS